MTTDVKGRVYRFFEDDPTRRICFPCLCVELNANPDDVAQAITTLQAMDLEVIRERCPACNDRPVYRLIRI